MLSKYCECGTAHKIPLHFLHAEALLYDVRNCSDLRKDAVGIADVLSKVGTAIMGGAEHASGFAGWVLDNTRSNHAAMRLLEEKQPNWANLGCIAHGSALAMKDLCKHGRTKGRYSTEWGVEWLAQLNDDANTVANYINDSSPAKSLLRTYQAEIFGGTRQIPVSVPTRFATNLFVMEGVSRSKAAFVQAIADKKWTDLGGKAAKVCCTARWWQVAVSTTHASADLLGQGLTACSCAQVKEIMSEPLFWAHLDAAISLLKPFSDFIHQIEADRPSLGRCYVGLMQLDAHVRASIALWEEDDEMAGSCESALRTWERRLDNRHSNAVVPLLCAEHTATFLLDPLYAVAGAGKDVSVPIVADEHEDAARKLIERIGGAPARRELVAFMTKGWSGSLTEAAQACIPRQQQGLAASSKRERNEVAPLSMRKGVWKRYGSKQYPALAQVALRLLSMHGTSAATERNWALWGRVYTASRNRLGLERAKKLISFCFNSRAQSTSTDDFELLLSVVEGVPEGA